jgi:CMP-N-acetylneuraminic acid synthetase
VPRQQLPRSYDLNGCAYAFWMDRLPADARTIVAGRVGAVVIPHERGFEIDEPLDFEIVEFLLLRRVRLATGPGRSIPGPDHH